MAVSLETCWLTDGSVIRGSALCDGDECCGCAIVSSNPAAVAGSTGRSSGGTARDGNRFWKAGCNGDFVAAAPNEKSGGRCARPHHKDRLLLHSTQPDARLRKDS